MNDDSPQFCGECGRELRLSIRNSHLPEKEAVYLVCPKASGWFSLVRGEMHTEHFVGVRSKKLKYDIYTGDKN